MADESWARARRIAERQRWLITAEQARLAGLSPAQIWAQIRSGAWVALMHGVYLVDADMYADLPANVWWRAALLAHGWTACLVGRSAARSHGAEGLPPADVEVDIAVVGGPPRAVQQLELPGTPVDGPLVVVRQWPVAEEEVCDVDGMRVRDAGLSVVDAALLVDRVHSLCVFDWALRAGVHTRESLAATVSAAKRRPGVVHVREMAELADERAATPLESRVRLACVDGEVPPDELQYRVTDRWERVVAIGDLAWFKKRRRPLLAEADGEDVHSKPRAVLHDRRRGNSLVIETCDVVRFTWSDSLVPAYIQQVIRSALAA